MEFVPPVIERYDGIVLLPRIDDVKELACLDASGCQHLYRWLSKADVRAHGAWASAEISTG